LRKFVIEPLKDSALKVRLTLLLLSIFSFSFSQSSRVGIPFVINYKPEVYNAADQNWCIVQDKIGMLYFANNNGVLNFNGSTWQIVGTAKNLSAIHSLAIDKKGTIYAGGYADIGIIEKNKIGQVQYVTITDKIPLENRKFDYVWNICPTRRGIVFQSTYSSFYYVDDSIEVIPHPAEFTRSFYVSDRLFTLFKDALREITDGRLIDVPLGQEFASLNVAFMLPLENNSILVGSESKGLFIYDFKKLTRFKTSADDFIEKNKLYSGIYTQDNNIALGTLHGGLLLIDRKGNPVTLLNTDNGLQNNTILSMKSDNLGNLWLTMDQGIDYIELSSPFSKIKSKFIDGNVYSITLFKGNLYIATHHGLFWQNWEKLKQTHKMSDFNSLEGVSEINWSLTDIDGTLFLGHDKGSYIINDNKVLKLSDIKGGWCFRKLKLHPDLVLGGTYNCLVLYSKQNGKWKFKKVLNGISESCRIIEEDNNENIWITSGYYGVYKIRLSKSADSIESIKFYDSKKGFPQSLFFGINKIGDEVIFGTQYGVYSYNSETDRMEPHKYFYPLLKENHIRKMVEGPNNTIWYIAGTTTGILKRMGDGSYNQILVPFQKIDDDYFPGFENINFIDDKNVAFGTKHGILLYNPEITKDYHKPYYTIIDKVVIPSEHDSIINNSGLSGTDIEKNKIQTSLAYKHNDLRFTFSALYFENPKNIEFKYMLEGFDEDWSIWSTKNEKEYTNIPEGTYTFRVKAKNIYDFESTEATFKFTVLPPWYRTTWAYIGYFLIIITLFWLFIQAKNKKFEKEKKKLEIESQKALHLKITEHAKEKLEEELQSRQKELAAATMNIAQKNEKFLEIKEKLTAIDILEKDRRKINSLVKLLDDELNDDSYWTQFEKHFNSLNDNFIKRLQNEHPTITHKDLKMCAFLRMNLSNKEIASLLNITLRGVEASRLRLRRKLDLPKETPLTEYMMQY
jgi:ligand-binding sensor domain-containing protein/DNA-binding protein H-NS/DNA-binding CsgD family transcriptional regulator